MTHLLVGTGVALVFLAGLWWFRDNRMVTISKEQGGVTPALTPAPTPIPTLVGWMAFWDEEVAETIKQKMQMVQSDI